MTKRNVFTVILLPMVFSCILLYAKGQDRRVNSDIIISGFETIVMEQGAEKVYPVFRLKNRGKRIYTSVSLRCTQPLGKRDLLCLSRKMRKMLKNFFHTQLLTISREICDNCKV